MISIFKQDIYEKEYYIDTRYYTRVIHKKGKKIKEKEWKFEIDEPPLNADDRFYIESENKYLNIIEVIRTSENNTLYICHKEIVDTEDSLKEKELLEEKVKELLEEQKLKKEEQNIIEQNIVDTKKLTLFQKIKNIFK